MVNPRSTIIDRLTTPSIAKDSSDFLTHPEIIDIKYIARVFDKFPTQVLLDEVDYQAFATGLINVTNKVKDNDDIELSLTKTEKQTIEDWTKQLIDLVCKELFKGSLLKSKLINSLQWTPFQNVMQQNSPLLVSAYVGAINGALNKDVNLLRELQQRPFAYGKTMTYLNENLRTWCVQALHTRGVEYKAHYNTKFTQFTDELKNFPQKYPAITTAGALGGVIGLFATGTYAICKSYQAISENNHEPTVEFKVYK